MLKFDPVDKKGVKLDVLNKFEFALVIDRMLLFNETVMLLVVSPMKIDDGN